MTASRPRLDPDAPHRVEFDIAEIPFSTHRSWLNLSPVIAEHVRADDVHLVTHQTGLHAVLALVPQLAGDRVETTVAAAADRLVWRHPQGSVTAAFAAPDTVRLRGVGLGLRVAAAFAVLTPFSGTYLMTDPVDGAAVFTHYESGRRYRVTTLSGTALVVGDQALGRADRSVDVRPGPDGSWEIAIEEYETGRPPYRAERAFDRVLDDADADFAAFLADVAPWRSDRTPAAARAAYVIWSATVPPSGFLRRPSVLMSKHWMDKVWSWDHCFNALALAGGRPDLALDQFLTPFDHQDASGALPDSVTHSEVLHNFVKPPIHGWALTGLRRRVPGDLPADVLHGIYDQLVCWTEFWLERRRAPGHALPYYQHGNDSGWDNATVFDEFRVIETADLAAFLIQQLGVLADLADELGHPADARRWRAVQSEVRTAVFDELWDGTTFLARDPFTGRASCSDSLLALLPIVLGAEVPADVRRHLVARLRDHLTTWGLATEPVSSPHYQADGYWRGPIWAPSTALVEDGLRRAGEVELADEISVRFRRLCETSGFAENFDAQTGAGLRDRAYTWTAAVYLLFAADAEQRHAAADPSAARADARVDAAVG